MILKELMEVMDERTSVNIVNSLEGEAGHLYEGLTMNWNIDNEHNDKRIKLVGYSHVNGIYIILED